MMVRRMDKKSLARGGAKKLTSVELIRLLKVLERNDGKHAAVAVHETAHVDRVALHLTRQHAAALGEVHKVARRLLPCRNVLKLRIVTEQRSAHVDELLARHELELGVFGERDANGIAQAVCEQGANANCALHATVFALACLGDAQVHRVVPSELVHFCCQQAVRLYHDERIAGLH